MRTPDRTPWYRLASLLLVGFTFLSGPASADYPADKDIALLRTICSTPGFDIDTRVKSLSDWRPANAIEISRITELSAGTFIKVGDLVGFIPPEQQKEIYESEVESFVFGLDMPADNNRGATRAMVLKLDTDHMLVLDANGPWADLVCRLIVVDPSNQYVADLIYRFSIFPPRISPPVRHWGASYIQDTDANVIRGNRFLTLLQDENTTTTAMLEFAFSTE